MLNKTQPSALKADSSNCAIRSINLTTNTVTTVAGSPPYTCGSDDGVGTGATFNYPSGVAVNSAGTFAVVVSLGINDHLGR